MSACLSPNIHSIHIDFRLLHLKEKQHTTFLRTVAKSFERKNSRLVFCWQQTNCTCVTLVWHCVPVSSLCQVQSALSDIEMHYTAAAVQFQSGYVEGVCQLDTAGEVDWVTRSQYLLPQLLKSVSGKSKLVENSS